MSIQQYHKIRKEIRKYRQLKAEIRIIKNLKVKLLSEYGNVIESYNGLKVPSLNNEPVMNIWFMWWQGFDQMPEVIKINYEALLHNANGNKIMFLTQYNIKDYIQLPDYILEKVEKGVISLTHLSDLIRVKLLREHGGLWLDATVYVTQPLKNVSSMTYWSTKWIIPNKDKNKYKLWAGLWEVSSLPKLMIPQFMGIWFSIKDNPIFACLEEFWLAYWRKENNPPYYWTTEVFLIGCMYENIDSVKKQIDELKLSNSKVFDLRDRINELPDEKILQSYMRDTQYFYLSWKSEYREYTENSEKLTTYGHLLRDSQYLNKLVLIKLE